MRRLSLSSFSKENMIRAYKLKLKANQTKVNTILEIAKEYRKTAKIVLNNQLYLLFTKGSVDKYFITPIEGTKLSARYLQTLRHQVVGMLDSYLSNRQNDFIYIVKNSSVDKRNRKSQELFICGFCHKKQNSDINASKNILFRTSKEKLSSIYNKKEKILDELVKLFVERCNKRVFSCPVILSNLYFNKVRLEWNLNNRISIEEGAKGR